MARKVTPTAQPTEVDLVRQVTLVFKVDNPELLAIPDEDFADAVGLADITFEVADAEWTIYDSDITHVIVRDLVDDEEVAIIARKVETFHNTTEQEIGSDSTLTP